METLQKRNNWPQKIILFVLACVLISTLLRSGSNYYFSNYWTSGIEKQMLNKCILDSKNNSKEGISEEKIANYCNCNLQKIKAKYKPKEVSTINQNEFEAIANECVELIK